MNRRPGIAGLIALLAGTALGAGQTPQSTTSPPPTFKAEVEYVEVDALVTDEQGQFVRDLKQDEFQVFEDGKRQTISTFTMIDIPVERSEQPLLASAPIDPDVATNERPFEGRVYVLVLDDLHTDVLRSQRVKAAAGQFIERNLGANDLMAVLFTSGRAGAAQEFTSNKRLLLAAVDNFMGRRLQSATLARNENLGRLGLRLSDRPDDPFDAERGLNARSTLTTLRNVGEWFGGVRGRRKTILFVSEGIDYDITDIFNSRSASSVFAETRDAIGAATRSNVSIYTVDPRGLSQIGGDTIGVSSFAGIEGTRPPEDNGNSGGAETMRKPGLGLSALQNELWLAQSSLRVLAEETGGFAAIDSNQFATAFGRIVSDNSSYYVLAYYPPSPKRDGRFHRIEVRVTRPGLTVRARRGYASPKGKPAAARRPGDKEASPALVEALNSPINISGLGLRVFASPFKGTGPDASVLLGVELLGRNLKVSANGKVEFSYVAIDASGRTRGGGTEEIMLNLRPETLSRVQQFGFRLFSRLDLSPGRYQLRVAARDTTGGALGSVLYDLEIPDYDKEPFSMSGLVLTSLSTSGMVTARPDEQLREVLPAAPVAERIFPQNDELALFAEVYDDGRAAPHKVDIVTTVRSHDGTVIFKNEEERASSELQGLRGAYAHTARIPLTELTPGSYVLMVEARSRLGQAVETSRQVQFTVVPRRN